MAYYDIIRKHENFLNKIEYSLYKWKLYNIVGYTNALIYHNDNLITFYFEISEHLYNFKVVYNTDINSWILHFTDDINTEDETHIKILNMVDNINYRMLSQPKTQLLNYIMDLIEKTIDETNFNESDSLSSEESETSSSESKSKSISISIKDNESDRLDSNIDEININDFNINDFNIDDIEIDDRDDHSSISDLDINIESLHIDDIENDINSYFC